VAVWQPVAQDLQECRWPSDRAAPLAWPGDRKWGEASAQLFMKIGDAVRGQADQGYMTTGCESSDEVPVFESARTCSRREPQLSQSERRSRLIRAAKQHGAATALGGMDSKYEGSRHCAGGNRCCRAEVSPAARAANGRGFCCVEAIRIAHTLQVRCCEGEYPGSQGDCVQVGLRSAIVTSRHHNTATPARARTA